MKHYSVLLEESINGLQIKENGIYIDATLGYGGHSSAILKKLTTGHLYAFDQDQDAIVYAKERLSSISPNFTLIPSPQIDTMVRGFSFMSDAPLDMRMDQTKKLDARYIVNTYGEKELTAIFYLYGEERMSYSIAKKIVMERNKKAINTTKELVKIIESSVGAKYFNKFHPERQIFQAIRIEVNSELKVLGSVLPDAIDLLKPEGRMAVISFHSLEDRIVKQLFKKESEIDELVRGLPQIPEQYKPRIKIINKKPILPSEKELEENTRSRSAKLRIMERI